MKMKKLTNNKLLINSCSTYDSTPSKTIEKNFSDNANSFMYSAYRIYNNEEFATPYEK